MDQGKFIIFPIEASPEGSNGSDMGNVTTVKEVVTARTVVGTKYYNLMGVKYNSMPIVPGIYIHNGKKVVVK